MRHVRHRPPDRWSRRAPSSTTGGEAVSTRLVQLRTADGERMVGVTRDGETHRIKDATSMYALAQRAIDAHVPLEGLIDRLGMAEPLNLAERLERKQVLTPIDHADPAHVW